MTDGMTAADTLRALADDWNDRCCGLYVHLRDGAEERWGVDSMHYGSVAAVLREIADAAEEEQKALRAFAERVHGMLWGDGWHPFDEIADKLEEELSELDALRSVGSEADKLVRDHGGLDAVRDRLERVETWDADKAALFELCAECGGVDGVRARMMPEGVEWPRYEDGEPVRIGDEFECWCGETHTVESVTIREGRSALNASKPHMFVISDGPFTAHGKRVKRPVVLAADGEPLEVGQTVWHVDIGMEFTVNRLPKPGEYQAVEVRYRNGSSTSFDPDQLTHQRPVLDADGVLCREGDEAGRLGKEAYTVRGGGEKIVRCNDCIHAVIGFADGVKSRAVIGCDRFDRPTKRIVFEVEPDGFCAWGRAVDDD